MSSFRRLALNTALAAGALGLAYAVWMPLPAQAASSMGQCLKTGRTELQCRCDVAIEIGTSTALKKFIATYGRTHTACNAAASTLGIKVPLKPTPSAVAAEKVKNNNGLGNGDEGNCTGGGCSDASNPGNGGTSGSGSNGGGGNGGNGGGGNGGGKSK